MNAVLPSGFTEVDGEAFENWLANGSPDYKVSSFVNADLYLVRSNNDTFAYATGGKYFVDPKYLK